VKLWKTASVLFAATMMSVACQKTARNDINAGANTNTNMKEAQAQPSMTVTGCLQNGEHGAFILTALNEPSQPLVGTTGSPDQVKEEQLRSAEKAYRINPKDDIKLDDLVGKQVRVSGSLAKASDLPEGTSGASADNSSKPLDLDQGDLAKIDATSVTQVGATCDGGSAPKNGDASKK
jgi:hypothetical protein